MTAKSFYSLQNQFRLDKINFITAKSFSLSATSPWAVGMVYLSASVESERTMVDLPSLGLLVGRLLCRF